MKKVLALLKSYRKESVLSPAFKLLESLMDLITPLVVAAIINRGIVNSDFGYVIKCFLFLILLAVLGLGFSFTAQWFAAKASVGVATDLRQDLFDHIQKLSCGKLDSIGTDTLITRMTSDINQVQNGVNMSLRLVLRSPFIVFGAMIMAFTIDFHCALIFALAIPVLSVVVYGIMILSIPMFSRVQASLDKLLGTTRENLTGVRVIRAFCKEKEQISEFDSQSMVLTKMNEAVGRLSALMNPATYALINIATIFLIRESAIRVNMGSIAQGDVVALYNYMAQIIVELIKLASLIITINKALACAKRVETVLDVKAGMTYPESVSRDVTETENEVEFRHVSFSYEGSEEEAVTDIDFSVKKGQTVGIIGGTGSGKSTVVNLIPRFYDVTKGSILVSGTDVRNYPEGELIKRIGVVPQKAVLFEGTIRENMKWGNEKASDEDIWKALETAQGREVVEGKEGKLDSKVNQGGRNFSGGQKQRLTIARALVRKPEILILDDSASALDFATDLRLRRAIAGLEGDMTVFIVSQRASSVQSADLILVLDDGMIVGKGTHEELLKSCEVYQEIYYSQVPDERKKADPAEKEALA